MGATLLVLGLLELALSSSVPTPPLVAAAAREPLSGSRPAVSSLTVLSLRGGEDEEEEPPKKAAEEEKKKSLQPDEDAPYTRLRMVVAAGTTDDPSLVELSKADVESMAIEAGSHVTLRGAKQRRTTCVVVVDPKLKAGEARLSSLALSNVRLSEGEDVIVAPEADLPGAERVLLLPFASDLENYEGTLDDAFDTGLAPYLKDNERPLTVGDIIETTAGEGDGEATVRWKVLELEPEAANPIEAARGTFTSETMLFTDGDPLEDGEADDSDVIGYEDIGGLDKQMALIRELVDLPLRHPAVFDEIGVRPPRGVLLTGPPGSGKTMVANAIKAETGVYFQTVNGPEVMSKRSGESEAGLRKTFEDAEANSPSIIFIDEIDAIAPKREKAQVQPPHHTITPSPSFPPFFTLPTY